MAASHCHGHHQLPVPWRLVGTCARSPSPGPSPACPAPAQDLTPDTSPVSSSSFCPAATYHWWCGGRAACVATSWSALAGASLVQGGLRLCAQLLVSAGGGSREDPQDMRALGCWEGGGGLLTGLQQFPKATYVACRAK